MSPSPPEQSSSAMRILCRASVSADVTSRKRNDFLNLDNSIFNDTQGWKNPKSNPPWFGALGHGRVHRAGAFVGRSLWNFLALLSKPDEDGPGQLCCWGWRSQAVLLSQGIILECRVQEFPSLTTSSGFCWDNPFLCCSGSKKTILLLPQSFNCVWELVNRAQAVCDQWVPYLSPEEPFPGSCNRSLARGAVLAVSQASCCTFVVAGAAQPLVAQGGSRAWCRGAAPSSGGDPCTAAGKGSVWCGQSTFIWPQSPAPR